MLSCTQEFARNNHSLNFIGTFIDLADLGIAHVPLSGVFLAVAVAAAEDLDAFDGEMIGNGFLPALLHQDPRYFRMGHGAFTHRLLFALATTVVCKHDNSGKWEPNYSNVLGNIASGGISNLYYPSSGSGIGQTFTNGFIVTAEGGVGSIFQEFWPAVSRKILHKDPTHGLDAQARAQDAAEEKAKQNR